MAVLLCTPTANYSMVPPKTEGYKPLDLESTYSSGQWRTIEEHERLQQERITSSSSSEGPVDCYKQQRHDLQQQSKKKIVWAVGGESHAALVVAVITCWVQETYGNEIGFSEGCPVCNPLTSCSMSRIWLLL